MDCVLQINLVLHQFDSDTKTPFDVCHKIFWYPWGRAALSVPGCHHYGDVWIMGAWPDGKWRCAEWCSVCEVRRRWGLATVQWWYTGAAQAQSWDCQPVGLKMAPGQLSPLSFCQQNIDTQSCLGSLPTKLCTVLPRQLSSFASLCRDIVNSDP